MYLNHLVIMVGLLNGKNKINKFLVRNDTRVRVP